MEGWKCFWEKRVFSDPKATKDQWRGKFNGRTARPLGECVRRTGPLLDSISLPLSLPLHVSLSLFLSGWSPGNKSQRANERRDTRPDPPGVRLPPPVTEPQRRLYTSVIHTRSSRIHPSKCRSVILLVRMGGRRGGEYRHGGCFIACWSNMQFAAAEFCDIQWLNIEVRSSPDDGSRWIWVKSEGGGSIMTETKKKTHES